MHGVAPAKRIRARFNLPIVYLAAHPDEATLQEVKYSSLNCSHLRTGLRGSLTLSDGGHRRPMNQEDNDNS